MTNRTRTLSLLAALTLPIFLSVLSARTIIGTYFHGHVQGILDDRASEESVTLKDLSDETVPAYREAVGMLERAIFFDPSRALYRRTLSDIYRRLGSWAETMEVLNASLPEGVPLSKEAFEYAMMNVREAIRHQPTNPDNHLAYGHLSREMKDLDKARSEYRDAANAYPCNSALRYSVVMEYLAAGMQVMALEQAIELARIDDSYKMFDSYAGRLAAEQRTPFYLNSLMSSYLFKALEVVWRTSNNDMNLLRGIVPDNDEARDVERLFLQTKRVDQ